ncbi:MAG: histidine kinase [Tissierellia bacterium]|nr:histidine kinase [Tissierellia bacterium]MDD4781145.1 histidine kinase [Tissierellia bacterium]
MNEQLLTKNDLAKRWQVSERTIDNYIKDGTVQTVKTISAVRFAEHHIRELEGIKLDRMSPLERRKLELQIEKLQTENKKLKEVINNILVETSKVIGMLSI